MRATHKNHIYTSAAKGNEYGVVCRINPVVILRVPVVLLVLGLVIINLLLG